tara:strand:+ start:2018 stop:2407 length:390 start_codon:yes stop_codon:yes gene_type:complete
MKVNIGEYPDPEIEVRIDKEDTWSMDYTLAHVILPMLKQLKESKHGSPFTDDEDVPEELRSTVDGPKINKWDTDSNFHARWNWIMDEMIWAFEQKCEDDWMFKDNLKEHQKRMTKAFKMFGRYYENLWD